MARDTRNNNGILTADQWGRTKTRDKGEIGLVQINHIGGKAFERQSACERG